jgi:hypothetical protein
MPRHLIQSLAYAHPPMTRTTQSLYLKLVVRRHFGPSLRDESREHLSTDFCAFEDDTPHPSRPPIYLPRMALSEPPHLTVELKRERAYSWTMRTHVALGYFCVRRTRVS